LNLDSSTLPIRRGVVGVIVRDARLLVIRRAQGIAAPGAYCFPGGGIEADETEDQALVRELREELGIEAVAQRPLWSSQTPWRVALSWWQADFDPQMPLLPNPAEVESIHWLTLPELAAWPGLLSSNHDFLAALKRGEFQLNATTGEGA
jgi:8-oxo-dGTP pyrophosphatase MutT (NUDIX family)